MLVLARQDRLDLLGNDDIFRLPSPVSRGDLLAAVRLLLQVGRRLERYGPLSQWGGSETHRPG